jgi:hypothetical protein
MPSSFVQAFLFSTDSHRSNPKSSQDFAADLGTEPEVATTLFSYQMELLLLLLQLLLLLL